MWVNSFYFKPALDDKVKKSFCLLLWNHLLKTVPKAASLRLCYALIGWFFPVHGVWNNFQNHRRLSEQLLESHAAIEESEQAHWRGLLEGFSQFVSHFRVEASRKQNFFGGIFFTKRQANILQTTSAHSKSNYCFDGEDLQRKYSSRDTTLCCAFFRYFIL